MCQVLNAGIIVDTFDQLVSVLETASPGDTILIKDGSYSIVGTWALQVRTENLTIKSLSGIRENVIIKGRGMFADSHHGFWVNADHTTISDLTIQNVRNHCIQTDVDVDYLFVKNCVLRDAGEQMLKVPNADAAGSPSENGLVEDCLFTYSAGIGPQYYIGGIDCHFAKDWIVRRNVFRDIASPSNSLAEHAIHFWSWSENTICENNLIINCDRGIGYGLSNSGHKNGIIRNNIIFHDESLGGGFADVSIEVFYSDNAAIYNNTIYQQNPNYFCAIKNWGGKNVSILNNAVNMSDEFYGHLNQAIWITENGSGTVSHNYISIPQPELFAQTAPPGIGRIDQVTEFLQIADNTVTQLIDAGTDKIPNLPDPFYDFKGANRPSGAAIDIGADEFIQDSNIDGGECHQPYGYLLKQNYPNPFNCTSLIEFSIPRKSLVGIYIYNIFGQKVETLINHYVTEGQHAVIWDAHLFPSGVYFVKMSTLEYEKTIKMSLLK